MNDVGPVVETLNRLLQAESVGLAVRLGEARPFAHPATAEQLAAVRRWAAQSHQHLAWLNELIISLRGVPAHRPADTSTADLHYLRVDVLLPRLMEDCAKLIEAYRAAAGRVAEVPPAAELVARIRTRHEDTLRTLADLCPATPGE